MDLVQKSQTQYLQSWESLNPIEKRELYFVKKFDIKSLLKTRIRSFDELKKISSPDIDSLTRFESEDFAIKVVFAILRDSFKLTSIEVSEEQILLIAEQICIDFPSLSIKEIKLLNRMVVLGQLGKLYHEITPDKYFGQDGFISKYIQEREIWREKAHAKRKLLSQAPIKEKKGVPMPEKYKYFSEKLLGKKIPKYNYKSLGEYYKDTQGEWISPIRSFILSLKKEYSSSELNKFMSFREYRNRRQAQEVAKINF